MVVDKSETPLNLIWLRQELTPALTYYALVTGSYPLFRLLHLIEDISLYAYLRVFFQQINLHPPLCAVEIDHGHLIQNFHPK